ncbi:MAG: hypothetical protein JXB18_09035 [Sedimentisphaerales bacterium]|nr:hypothetical protein [Sedimentisphaerales bacterium]
MIKNKKTDDVKQIGWKVPPKVFYDFQDYCDSVGLHYQDAIAAAMVLFQLMPPSIQRQGQYEARGIAMADRSFCRRFGELLESAVIEQDLSQSQKKEHPKKS